MKFSKRIGSIPTIWMPWPSARGPVPIRGCASACRSPRACATVCALVAVGSLDALCEVAREDYEAGILAVEDWERAVLCPMVDARRMEVYTQLFDAQGEPLTEVSAEVVDAGSFSTWRAKGPFVIFGSGAAKCADVLSDAVLVHVAPSARGLARLAQTAFDGGDFADLAYFEPFYLKDFVVTTSRKKLF